MASFLLSGSMVEARQVPTAVLQTDREFTVLGSSVLLDGRLSTDPDNAPLSYAFSFISVPIGSKVALEGFRSSEDGAVATFSPDLTGPYVIGLVVSNGVFESKLITKTIEVRSILVPHAKGMVPDGKFIWSYLRDVWTQVDGKEFFEVLWSALVQISGAELLKLYQVDFNKSIADIQELFQRRWLKYEPKLAVDAASASFFFGAQSTGAAASTGSTGESGLAIVLGPTELVAMQGAIRPDLAGRTFRVQYSRSPENVADYIINGVSSKPGGFFVTTPFPKNPANSIPPEVSDLVATGVPFEFEFQSTRWTIGGARVYDFIMSEILGIPTYKNTVPPGLENARVGDVIYYPSGPNAGFYTIVVKDPSAVTVDRAPPSSSSANPATLTANIYRPIGFSIPPVEESLTDTITVPLSESADLASLAPGRVIIFNGEAKTVSRVSIDETQRVPVAVVVVEEKAIIPGLRNLAWYVPHTLVSKTQNFEELGVSAGDTLLASISDDGGLAVDVPLQVVGVDGYRLGFVFSTEPLSGSVAPVPLSTIETIVDRFGIKTVTKLPDGTVKYQDEAATMRTTLQSIFFKRAYWGRELTQESAIKVGTRTFYLSPKTVIRNSKIPVDTSLRSVPSLQEYIKQPEVEEKDGQLYQKYNDQLLPLERDPVVLTERFHYVIDAEVAYDGELTFRTNTDVLDADGGDFVDIGVSPGDSFEISTPLTLAGKYPVAQVLSRNRLKLARKIPKHVFGDFVTAKVRLVRGTNGRFLRLIPGLFTAKRPAPERLWGEVSFFDNNENIERNFGVLVGLSRADIEAVSGNASYRQAVAGLMYSYVNGPAVDKVRLGASLLLGLPFTEKRGIIRSIENDYRRDSAGNAVLGRILVEDVDSGGTPLGIMRVYTFPIDEVSALAGVDTNPATGVAYAVGDIVEAYASLAKGVEINDFMTRSTGLSAVQMLQRYHSVQVRINDNIFKPEEIGLVSDFLRRITPSYVALVITNSSEYRDTIEVKDRVRMRMTGNDYGVPPFLDTVGATSPVPTAFGAKLFSGIHWRQWDKVPLAMRRAGKDIVVDGADPTLLRVPSAGLLNPRVARQEEFDSPLCRVGDVLVIRDGIDAGVYSISEITDSTLKVSDGPSRWSFAGTVHFSIGRPAGAKLRSGAIEAVGGGTWTDPDTAAVVEFGVIDVAAGVRSDYVAPGDWLLVSDGITSSRHTVIGIGGPNAPFPVPVGEIPTAPFVSIYALPPIPAGATQYEVWRPQAFTNEVSDFTLTSDGTNSVSVSDPFIHALAEVGDELQLQDTAKTRLLVLDPLNMWVVPAPPDGDYQAKLLKAGFGSLPYSAMGQMPLVSDKTSLRISNEVTEESLNPWKPEDDIRTQHRPPDAGFPAPAPDCDISGRTVSWGSYGAFNPAAAGFRPGDFFQPASSISNNMTRDLGYGPALYPIVEVSATTVKLSVALASGRSKWGVIRRA